MEIFRPSCYTADLTEWCDAPVRCPAVGQELYVMKVCRCEGVPVFSRKERSHDLLIVWVYYVTSELCSFDI